MQRKSSTLVRRDLRVVGLLSVLDALLFPSCFFLWKCFSHQCQQLTSSVVTDSLTVELGQEVGQVMLKVLVCLPGMLRRWDDSQKFLSDYPHLVCKETANCLVVICIDYDIDEVGQSIDHLQHHHHVVCPNRVAVETRQIWQT